MFSYLPERIRVGIQQTDFCKIREIRLRVNNPPTVKIENDTFFISENGPTLLKSDLKPVSDEEILSVLESLTSRSLYAYNDQIRELFFTTEEGERIGIGGECAVENGTVLTVKKATSLLIRVPHEIKGLFQKISNFVKCENKLFNTLFVSMPSLGKTTMLKSAARSLSESGENVLVLDERGELYLKDVNADYIRFSDKEFGFERGVRVLAPDVVVCDELGSKKDFLTCQKIVSSGITVFASMHGDTFPCVLENPFFVDGVFDRYVFFKKDAPPCTVAAVYGKKGEKIF